MKARINAGVPCAVVLLTLAGCMVYPRGGPVYVAPPAAVVVAPAPRLVILRGFDLQYCPDCDEDVFFYGGIWYVYRSGGWYWCGHYGEPWVVVKRDALPNVFIKVPPGHFKHRYHEHHPAHEYYPDQDTWSGDDQGGGASGKGKKKGGGRGKGRGRGHD